MGRNSFVFRIDETLHNSFKKVCTNAGISMSDVIEEMIKLFLENEEIKKMVVNRIMQKIEKKLRRE